MSSLSQTPVRASSQDLRLSDLSLARQELVEMMEEVGFGQVLRLLLVDHEPRFTPRPRRAYTFALEKQEGSRPQRNRKDYVLKGTLQGLFYRLDRIHGSAWVDISIQNGMPVRLSVEEIPED